MFLDFRKPRKERFAKAAESVSQFQSQAQLMARRLMPDQKQLRRSREALVVVFQAGRPTGEGAQGLGD